jgi:hypothetical protein
MYLLALLHLLSVILFDEKSVGKPHRLFPERRILLVTWNFPRQRFHGDALTINKIEPNATISSPPKKGVGERVG